MVPVTITGGGANHATVTRLAGFSIHEDASATAVIELRQGAVGGQIIAIIALAAGESVLFEFRNTMPTPDGVYVKEVSGSIEGVLFAENL